MIIIKDKSGIFSLITISILCILLIIGGTIYISDEKNILTGSETVTEYTLNAPKENKTEENSSVTVSASAKAEVLGKVVPQFISPYNSKTSYNRVYVKNRVGIDLDIASFLKNPNYIKLNKNGQPQILIMHTHTTECYLKEDRNYYTKNDLTRTRDKSFNVTAVGNVIANKLNKAGFVTIHDTTEHDYPSYNGSYNRSGETVKKYLEKYPSIKIVIDIHRDSLAGNGVDRVKPIVEINGKKSAQVMLVMGCGETLDGFENWKKNFSFAVKYQQTLEVLYPGLARQISFVASRYNQHLTTGSILLEVGTESNSLEEAKTAADFAATALISYLNTLV